MNAQTVLMEGIAALRVAGIDDPARDARLLMAHVLGVVPGRLTLHLQDEVDEAARAAFSDLVKERQARRPLSHLLGRRQFYGREFIVTPKVLDPRGDTETLIAAALSEPFKKVLDLGTGSGCILLTLLAEKGSATGTGTDVSGAALAVAERNAAALGVAGRCAWIESDWFTAVGGEFDLIVSNPPYIAAEEMAGLAPELSHEPREALTDESDGLSAYRVITAGARAHLRPGGRLMVEIGWTQGRQVSEMFTNAGFSDVDILPDLDGRDRVVWGRLV